MKAAIVDKGVVTNVILYDSKFVLPVNAVPVADNAWVGPEFTYDGVKFAAPIVAPSKDMTATEEVSRILADPVLLSQLKQAIATAPVK